LKNHWLIALNIAFFAILTSLLSALQTSLWFQVLGPFPPPQFWIVILTYSILNRHLWEGVLMTYILTLVIASFTAYPIENFLLVNMGCLMFISFIKNRIYLSSPTYFMLMSGSTLLVYDILFTILSQFADKNPIHHPAVFDWIISLLLTMLASLPLYRFLKWVDNWTDRNETAETTSGMI
jgi:hypothetical protein